MEKIQLSVPAILQVDSQHIACVLPWDLHNLCSLKTQLKKLQRAKMVLFKDILEKMSTEEGTNTCTEQLFAESKRGHYSTG